MLDIVNLHKTYADGTRALNNINLSLPSGMVGLLGPNGAGKSSLMRTLATLQAADSGTLTFAGLDINKNPQALRQRLGYLPQEFGVYPHMSCMAVLQHIAILKGLHDKHSRQQQIDALLKQTNLSAVAHKTLANFSGGMRQRFGIAQALLGDPRFIILDEPTAGLDPEERSALHQLLVSLSHNKLILLSTHIVEDIENLCPHVALMYGGQILNNQPVSQLIAPLQGQAWQSTTANLADVCLLSREFHLGQACYRYYAKSAPEPLAQRVTVRLQDAYFLAILRAQGVQSAE